MRAALYARYSTDNQSAASVEDQLRNCRQLAERMGAHVVREFADAGISGQSADNRPEFQKLMAFARAGGCDLVIADHSNRLSRAGSDGWAAWEEFKAIGVRYVTAQEGQVTAVLQGVSSLMSVMKLEETAHNTRRGIQGVVEAGRHGGGLSYGYRKKRLYDDAGEPVRGHLEIDEPQAQIVRRIFREYAAGRGARAIVTDLNAEGVPGPRGGQWAVPTITGTARLSQGIIHNVLYIGERVWGRRTFVKGRDGGRRGREAEGPPIRRPVPALRIVDDELWRAVRARHDLVSRQAAEGGPARARRPKRFLQGLIVCDRCGGPMHMAGPREALRCATRIAKGACSNTRTPGYPGLEARVLEALRESTFLRPDAIDLAVRTIQDELKAARRDAGRDRAKQAGELAEVKRRLARLIDQLEGGAPWSAIAERHGALDARREQLEAALSAEPDPADADVLAFPLNWAAKYRAMVEDLAAALATPIDPADHHGRDALRALITQIRVAPGEAHGAYSLEILGDLAPLIATPNEKSPLAGASFDRLASDQPAQSMGGLGAGTRVRRSLSIPFRQVA